ncbi:unnamed protein product [Symbiodinium necroappetens]|uniref:Secreted protein n=1 Tax=Symbiodinium necroappetens TaxID=1628268 RepID=A0A812XEL2_9DINO|nr:unnamed protein product [Symbiodinium necroappetens]
MGTAAASESGRPTGSAFSICFLWILHCLRTALLACCKTRGSGCADGSGCIWLSARICCPMLAAQQAQPRDYNVLPPEREEAAPHGAPAANPRGASSPLCQMQICLWEVFF